MYDVNLCVTEKIEFLRLATIRHKKLIQMALMGHGIERHFLGWKMVAEYNDIDISQFFDEDKGFKESENFIVTTSQVLCVQNLIKFKFSNIRERFYNRFHLNLNHLLHLVQCLRIGMELRTIREKMIFIFQ